jgi:hypothetical protein
MAALLVCVVTAADDINPPAWRGQAGSTLQTWEFLDDNNTPAPDIDVNPFGTAEMEVYAGFGQHWYSGWGGRIGV